MASPNRAMIIKSGMTAILCCLTVGGVVTLATSGREPSLLLNKLLPERGKSTGSAAQGTALQGKGVGRVWELTWNIENSSLEPLLPPQRR